MFQELSGSKSREQELVEKWQEMRSQRNLGAGSCHVGMVTSLDFLLSEMEIHWSILREGRGQDGIYFFKRSLWLQWRTERREQKWKQSVQLGA